MNEDTKSCLKGLATIVGGVIVAGVAIHALRSSLRSLETERESDLEKEAEKPIERISRPTAKNEEYKTCSWCGKKYPLSEEYSKGICSSNCDYMYWD